MEEPKIAIIGAGIGGLSAAFALSRSGFPVTVYEKAEQLGEVGAAIQLSSNVTSILHQWGLLPKAKKAGFLPKAVKLINWRSGQQIGRYPVNHTKVYDNEPYLHIHRADIHQILLDAFKSYHQDGVVLGAPLQSLSFDASTNKTTIVVGKGEKQLTAEYDWVIGADGIHSKVREYVAPDSKTRFTGNVAWRGMVPADKLSANLKPDPCANVSMGPGAHFVCYYVRGGRYLNYVAAVERSDWQEESWTIKASLDDMLEDFSGWNAQVRGVLARTEPDSCYRWALHDREPISVWHKNRCLLLGDAVHPMLPFLAQGAAMAIEDAQWLARCFAATCDDDQALIRNYTKERHSRTAKVQLAARQNMKIYHIRNPLIQVVRDQYLGWRGRSDPEFFNKRLGWLYDYRI